MIWYPFMEFRDVFQTSLEASTLSLPTVNIVIAGITVFFPKTDINGMFVKFNQDQMAIFFWRR